MVLKLRDALLAKGGDMRPLTRDELVSLASAVDLEALDLGEYRGFQPPYYRRNTVLLNDHFELVVICWEPGQASGVHDHGKSLCLYLVVEGTMSEELFELDKSGEPRETGARRWSRGDVTVADGPTIHRIHATDEWLVTVHIYSPPLGSAATMFTPIPTSAGN